MVTWENYEEYMMMAADGELGETELQALQAFVAQHPELKQELAAYMATRLVPDAELVYENKEALMKKGGGGTMSLRNLWVYGAAAAVILMVAITITKQKRNEEGPLPVAHNQTATPAPTTPDSAEELHSNPVNPVTIENVAANKQPVKEEKKTPVIKKPATPAPAQNEYIAKQNPKPAENKTLPKPQSLQPVQEQEAEPQIAVQEPAYTAPVIEKPAKEEMIASANTGKGPKEELPGWLPIREDKKEGAAIIANAVNEKLEKVKKLKDNFKNTDIAFRIGEREFIVKL